LAVLKNVHNSLSSVIQAAGLSISSPGLHQRFNQGAVDFLSSQLGRILAINLGISKRLQLRLSKQFKRVLIIDSSGWNLHRKLKKAFKGSGGSGSPAGIKLQFVFDLLSSAITHFDITQGNVPDQKYTNNIPGWLKKDDLILFDLGYFRLTVLNKITSIGAFFVARLLHGTALFVRHNGELKRLNLVSLLRKFKDTPVFELEVYLGAQAKVPCRVIVVQLSSKQRDAKIRKLRKKAQKKGRALSKMERFLAGYNLYVTNAPVDKLCAAEISQVYRLRWSIELLFKQFKSTLKLHEWNHGNKFRLQCEILGTLIVAAIIMMFHGRAQSLLWNKDAHEISFEKLFKLFKNKAQLLFDGILLSVKTLRNTIRKLLQLILSRCIKEARSSRPSSIQALETLDNQKIIQVPKHIVLRCVV